jgi:hypothetical protein
MKDRALGVHLDEVAALVGSRQPGCDPTHQPWLREPWADCVMAEVHLDPALDRIDALAAVVAPAANDQAGLTSLHQTLPQVEAAQALVRGRSEVAHTPMLWLEWDRRAEGFGAPLEFICVTDAILGAYGHRRPLPDPVAYALDAVAWCAGAEPSLFQDATHELIRKLAGQGELMHVTTLRPRGVDRVRLGFQVASQALVPWLVAIGWRGDISTVSAVAADASCVERSIGVQVEITPQVGSYIGLELPEIRASTDEAQSSWRQAELVKRFAAVEDHRLAAFFAWPGFDLDGESLRHGHLKLGFDGVWRAKGYFGRTRSSVVRAMASWAGIAAGRGGLLFE